MTALHPLLLSSSPDEAEEIAIITNTMKSFAAWVLARSAGAWHSVSSAEPPTYMKFQPTPSRNSANQKLSSSVPASAATMHSNSNTMPARMVFSTPKRLISVPVKNDGPYIPIMCHSSTNAASLKWWSWARIASGVEVIMRFMMP